MVPSDICDTRCGRGIRRTPLQEAFLQSSFPYCVKLNGRIATCGSLIAFFLPANLFFFHQSPSVRDGGNSADGVYAPSDTGDADDDTDGGSDDDTTSDESSSTGGQDRCKGCEEHFLSEELVDCSKCNAQYCHDGKSGLSSDQEVS